MAIDLVTRKELLELIYNLTPESLDEVRQFVEFLRFKQQDTDNHTEIVGQKPSDLGWPPGFFDTVIGGWTGEPLMREDQGGYEARNELRERSGQMI